MNDEKERFSKRVGTIDPAAYPGDTHPRLALDRDLFLGGSKFPGFTVSQGLSDDRASPSGGLVSLDVLPEFVEVVAG